MARWLVFDLDDTLYLERDYVASGFRAVDAYAASIGLVGFGERCWELFESGVRGDTFNRVLVERGMNQADLATRLVEVYRSHDPTIALLGDAEAAIQRCKASGVDLALLTGGPAEVQQKKVIATGIDRYIETVVLSGQWGPAFDKPHERSFREVQERAAAQAKDLTYIADNPAKDFVVPLKFGWSAIRVRRPGSLHESVETPDGVAECLDLSGLLDAPPS